MSARSGSADVGQQLVSLRRLAPASIVALLRPFRAAAVVAMSDSDLSRQAQEYGTESAGVSRIQIRRRGMDLQAEGAFGSV